jgi:hypothetical protein
MLQHGRSSPSYSQLMHSPRSSLFRILLSLNEPLDYTASKEVLVEQIRHRLAHPISDPDRGSLVHSPHFQSVCHFIFLTALVCAALLILLSIALSWVPSSPHFCDTNSAGGRCHQCPVFAECRRGRAFCAPNFSLIRTFCVARDGDEGAVAAGLEAAIEALRVQAGDYHCGRAGVDWLSDGTLLGLVAQKTEDPTIPGRVLDRLRHEKTVLARAAGESEIFATAEVRRGAVCAVGHFVFRNLHWGAAAVLAGSAVAGLTALAARRRVARAQGARFVALATEQLRARPGVDLTASQLRTKLHELSCGQADGLWAAIEAGLRSSPAVQHLTRNGETSYRLLPRGGVDSLADG